MEFNACLHPIRLPGPPSRLRFRSTNVDESPKFGLFAHTTQGTDDLFEITICDFFLMSTSILSCAAMLCFMASAGT